jgi:hypothetical protein
LVCTFGRYERLNVIYDTAGIFNISCPECGARVGDVGLVVQHAGFGESVTSAACAHNVDAWSALWRAIEFDGFGGVALALGGARVSVVVTDLRANERTTLSAADIPGMDEDAEIVSIHWTPQGGAVFPALFGPQRVPNTQIQLPLTLYGVPVDNARETRLAGLVQWLPKGGHDVGRQLAQAGIAFVDAEAHAGSYDGIVLPAQIALELAVTRLVDLLLSSTTGGERRERFFADVSYGHLLAVVMPALVSASFDSHPVLATAVLEQAQLLRKARNDLAHRGALQHAIERPEAARMLAGAASGVAFCQELGTRIGAT